MKHPDSRQQNASFLKLISAMLHIAKGNPPRTELVQRGLRLIAEWSHCDLIQLKADGEIGFCCVAGLRRDGDAFGLLPPASEHLQEDTQGSPERRGKDLLSAIQTSHTQGKRHGFFSPRGTFWTKELGGFLAQHGALLRSTLPCSLQGPSKSSSADGLTLDTPSPLVSGSSVARGISEGIEPTVDCHAIDHCASMALLHGPINDSSSLSLLIGWKDPNLLSERVIQLLEYSVDAFSTAYEHWWLAWSLGERLKELTCLHAISNLTSSGDITLDAFLGKVVEIIPEAWLHRDVAAARIILDEKEYASSGFSEGEQKLSAEIAISGQKRGNIEVNYTIKMPSMDEGPFLKEERKLLDAIAGDLSLQIERKLYQEEKRRVSEQLRHSNRLVVMGQLAAAVAHELNEPLTSILGFSQLAAKSPHLPEQVAKDLEKIVAISLHAREVVRKLLMYGGKMPERRSSVSINTTVRDVLNLFGIQLLRDGIALKLSLSERDPAIVADLGQMRQVVANLVLNAVQAMPGGGTLTIATDFEQGEVSLVVTDTGLGMSPEIKEKIFIPFFTTKSAGQGTGLGLSVVHDIVSGLEGTIHVESDPGEGSCFTVRIPVSGVSSSNSKRKKRRS